jgi:hypothetical protein
VRAMAIILWRMESVCEFRKENNKTERHSQDENAHKATRGGVYANCYPCCCWQVREGERGKVRRDRVHVCGCESEAEYWQSWLHVSHLNKTDRSSDAP